MQQDYCKLESRTITINKATYVHKEFLSMIQTNCTLHYAACTKKVLPICSLTKKNEDRGSIRSLSPTG